MATKKESDTHIIWNTVSVIERFSSVLYPLDIRELLVNLPSIGYIVPELIQKGIVEPGKPLATKGDVDLAINQDNKTIGVVSRSIENALAAYQELRDFYLSKLDPSPGLATQYIEIQANGWAKSQSEPTGVFPRFWAKCEPLKELGKTLNLDVTNYGVQLVPPNTDPNDPSWFHIKIEPHIASSAKRYHVIYIRRGTDVEKLLKEFSNIDKNMEQLISQLEKY